MSVREVVYFSLASALGLFTFVFYIFNKDARTKQRVWTVVHVLGGALFIAFMLGRDLSMIGTFFTVFGTLGFIYLSLGASRFCNRCSSLIFGPERPEWRGKCPSCGAALPWREDSPEEGEPPRAAPGPQDSARSPDDGRTPGDPPADSQP